LCILNTELELKQHHATALPSNANSLPQTQEPAEEKTAVPGDSSTTTRQMRSAAHPTLHPKHSFLLCHTLLFQM